MSLLSLANSSIAGTDTDVRENWAPAHRPVLGAAGVDIEEALMRRSDARMAT
jgi:hypothetical protein